MFRARILIKRDDLFSTQTRPAMTAPCQGTFRRGVGQEGGRVLTVVPGWADALTPPNALMPAHEECPDLGAE